ncbi:MAG TPA: hypothetical protein VL985_04185 [Stellaceae bacterium]|nr:hypothetical protein [Stellaceae bacterium]
MVESSRRPESAERAFWSWIGFWVQFLLLGLCVVLGAFVASNAAEPGDYAAGLVLVVSASAFAFLRLKQSFDDRPRGFGDFLFVDSMPGLVVIVPLFVVLAAAGLIIARAWRYGSLHDGGIALFVFSGFVLFLDIRQVFERMRSR